LLLISSQGLPSDPMDANGLGEVLAGQDGQVFLRVGRFDWVDVLLS
jgi:hypothetical protein